MKEMKNIYGFIVNKTDNNIIFSGKVTSTQIYKFYKSKQPSKVDIFSKIFLKYSNFQKCMSALLLKDYLYAQDGDTLIILALSKDILSKLLAKYDLDA